MKKRAYISFFVLLFLTTIAILTLIILIGRNKRAQKEAAEETSQPVLTPAATITPDPTASPVPTEAPVITSAGLYPAYRIEGNEKKYGYIDNSGNFVISPSFDLAGPFCEGAAVVSMNNMNMAIDTEGKVIYSNNTSLSDFCNGAAVFGDDSSGDRLYGYIDTNGKVMIEAKFKYAENFRTDNTAYVVTLDDYYALIDKSGNILETYIRENDIKGNETFHDGYIIYSESANNEPYDKYGVKNIKGEILIKPEYSSIRYLGDGYFAVTKPKLEYYETLFSGEALINASGTLLTEYRYYDISNVYNGLMSASDENSTFFMDTEGNRMTSLPFFEGIGTLKSYGDVIEAYIDGQKLYCNNKKIIFWQEEQSYELGQGLIVRSKKFRPNRWALVNYPYIEGFENPDTQDAVNLALEKIFTDPRKDPASIEYMQINDVFSADLMGNLLVIERSGYDFPFGAPHGSPFRFYYYIDIRSGRFYKFKDLFIEGTDYIGKINSIISSEINADLASEEPTFFTDDAGFKTISEEPLFILGREAITIYFAPYEIAPYAAGFPEFLIPFEDIDSFINRDGDFWKSFNQLHSIN